MEKLLEAYYDNFGRQRPNCLVDDISKLSEKEWLEYRQKGIGGSDAGTIYYGDSKFSTKMAIAQSKRGTITIEEKKPEDQFRLDFGHAMEEVIAKWYESTEKDVKKVFADRGMYQSKDHPFMIADTDSLAVLENGKIRGLEFKTTSVYNKSKWKSGTYGIDAEIGMDTYVIQVFHYMYVMDLDEYDLIVAFGNNANDISKIRFYREGNEDFINSIIQKEDFFWNNEMYDEAKLTAGYIDPNSKEKLAHVRETYQKAEIKINNETLLNMSREVVELQEQKSRLKDKIDVLEGTILAKKELIITAIDEGTSYCGDYVLNLKTKKRKGTYDPKVLDKHEKELSELGIERRPSTEKLELTVEERHGE